MKLKGYLVVSLALAFILTLAALAGAAGLAARGKFVQQPVANPEGAGSYVISVDEWNSVTLSANIRKLTAKESYVVGWMECQVGGSCRPIYTTLFADAKGNVKMSLFNGSVYEGNWSFTPFVIRGLYDPNIYPTILLGSEEAFSFQ